MKWHTISEVAEIVNLSRQAVYKRLKRLTISERKKLQENIKDDGQIMLSDEGVKYLFNVTTTVNSIDNPVDNEVVKTVNQEIIQGLQKQLNNKEQEVDRLDNILDNLCKQLDEERRLRGEERHRTDTILMKMTTEISGLQKALEYQKQDESVLQEASDKQHKKEKALLKQEIEKSREETEILKGKLFGLEVRHSQTTDKLKEGQDTLIRYLQEMQAITTRQARPWYKKLWSWLNQPITWHGKEVSVEIGTDPGQEKKKNTGLRPITEARAA